MADQSGDLATKQEIAAAGYWFGPRRRGRLPNWGWDPVSWKGWAVVAVCLPAFVVVEIAGRNEGGDLLYALPVVAAVVLLCVWKGTAPGPSARSDEQLREIARRQRQGPGVG